MSFSVSAMVLIHRFCTFVLMNSSDPSGVPQATLPSVATEAPRRAVTLRAASASVQNTTVLLRLQS